MSKAKLSVLSGRPTIAQYAQGLARDYTSGLADFIAPSVDVPKYEGKFKLYDAESRFKIPETLRTLGGPATIVEFGRGEANYDCKPHAIDTPLDDIEIDEAEGEDLIQEAAADVAFLAALSHEQRVLAKALTATAATGGVWGADANDPVAEMNAAIIEVIKGAAAGGMVEIGIAMDPVAAQKFFKNAKTRGYFPGMEAVAPTLENMQKLFMGNTTAKISYLVTDTAATGKAKSMNFMLNAKCLVFARTKNPTRRDPSFMKTFRRGGKWMVPGSYRKENDRGEVIKMDWSEDVQIANSEAARLFTVTDS